MFENGLFFYEECMMNITIPYHPKELYFPGSKIYYNFLSIIILHSNLLTNQRHLRPIPGQSDRLEDRGAGGQGGDRLLWDQEDIRGAEVGLCQVCPQSDF